MPGTRSRLPFTASRFQELHVRLSAICDWLCPPSGKKHACAASHPTFSCITPLILTYNEAPNIQRSLARLAWAQEILIVDSFSTDDTIAIASRRPGVRVLQRQFDSFAGQCNFGLQHVRTPWTLSLDADYLVSPALTREISQLRLAQGTAGYEARFRYCVLGRPLRASLYPPRTVLFRRDKAQYYDQGHSHRVRVDGPVQRLAGWLDHDDRKPFERWLHAQNRYALREAHYLLKTPAEGLNLQDRLRRKIVFAPFAVALYTLLAKGLILDGWPGFYYTSQRVLAEVLLSLRLIEERIRSSV